MIILLKSCVWST